eukprot:gene4277-40041_t
MAQHDTHLAKLVMLSKDNDGRWGYPLYRTVAAKGVALFEQGGDW